ncbi:hypothetical protein ABZ860_08560 [Microbispora sp. NPDC046973]|uniref:hypothetical protein n=1 Tax=Microbispora sp. NPDC046973 TaxID=3155022 RepID=UPI0033F8D2E2
MLTPAEAALVAEVAAPEMAAFGYLPPDDAGGRHPGGRPSAAAPGSPPGSGGCAPWSP